LFSLISERLIAISIFNHTMNWLKFLIIQQSAALTFCCSCRKRQHNHYIYIQDKLQKKMNYHCQYKITGDRYSGWLEKPRFLIRKMGVLYESFLTQMQF